MLFYILAFDIFVVMPINIWHGHEMVYGYTSAVIAGFLLTAVQNWTKEKTLNGYPLAFVFGVWCIARILAFVPGKYSVIWMTVFDVLFFSVLIFSITRPVLKVKQYKQFAVLSKVICLFITLLIVFVFVNTNSLKQAH